jgi:REP element-mobilizing transposase RayT
MRIRALSGFYDGVDIPKYVIMPNHIHMLIVIDSARDGGMRTSRPTLQTVIRSFKTFTTRQIGLSIWQDSFYEHIVRNNDDYLRIWQYIDGNPARWDEDDYHTDTYK